MPVERASFAPLEIRSAQGDYPVTFAGSQQELLAALQIDSSTVALVDAAVSALYPALREAFDPRKFLAVAASEEEKTLDGVARACLWLQGAGASKGTRLLVIGGGIVQDIGTFCAHIYYRGIRFEYVPTTVLSMADSCIGAKCALNLGSYKNQIGFFQSPAQVYVWPGFAATLAPDDVRSGFGEILKLAITDSAEAYASFENRMEQHGFALDHLEGAIRGALATKKAVIEVDEYDRGVRKTLNYGHTFGHALEAVTHNEVPHGLAVAWGLDLANFVASSLGLWPESAYRRVHELVRRHFAYAHAAPYDGKAIVEAMGRDKKASGATVQLILPAAFGDLRIVSRDRDDAFAALIQTYIDREDPFVRR